MGKLEYLDALKRAMLGLAPETQARTLAYYEQRFVDGIAAGRSEQDIATQLDDPRKIAMTLRASTHMEAFAVKKTPTNALRVVVSALGLAIFNLFMVVPAMVFGSLLAALYACALAFYVAGIAITASGLSGANELVLAGPLRHVTFGDDGSAETTQTRVSIGNHGIHVHQDKVPLGDQSGAAGKDTRAERGIHISTDMEAGSRTTQTLLGLGTVLGGIVLFLLSLVVTKYTFIGIKRYVRMNLSLLKGG